METTESDKESDCKCEDDLSPTLMFNIVIYLGQTKFIVGEQNIMRHGEGTLLRITPRNVYKYAGQWKDDMMHGKGVETQFTTNFNNARLNVDSSEIFDS